MMGESSIFIFQMDWNCDDGGISIVIHGMMEERPSRLVQRRGSREDDLFIGR